MVRSTMAGVLTSLKSQAVSLVWGIFLVIQESCAQQLQQLFSQSPAICSSMLSPPLFYTTFYLNQPLLASQATTLLKGPKNIYTL